MANDVMVGVGRHVDEAWIRPRLATQPGFPWDKLVLRSIVTATIIHSTCDSGGNAAARVGPRVPNRFWSSGEQQILAVVNGAGHRK